MDSAKKAADMGFGLPKAQLLEKTDKIIQSLKLKHLSEKAFLVHTGFKD